jgi:hypothetical protein
VMILSTGVKKLTFYIHGRSVSLEEIVVEWQGGATRGEGKGGEEPSRHGNQSNCFFDPALFASSSCLRVPPSLPPPLKINLGRLLGVSLLFSRHSIFESCPHRLASASSQSLAGPCD